MARRASRTSFEHRSCSIEAASSRRRGLTIVELLIVIVVIAILAAITIVAYTGIQNRAQSTAAISGAEQAGKRVAVYALGNGNALPTNQSSLAAETGLSSAGDTTYQYTLNSAVVPNTYCLTYTTGSTSAHVAGDAEGSVHSPIAGPCAGHAGTSPTTLSDGSGCPTGYIVVPGSSLYDTDAFCVMKYEAKDSGGVAVSQPGGLAWTGLTQASALSTASAACSSCHLISLAEWLTLAPNVMNVAANWSGGAVGSGSIYRGHTDSSPSARLAATSNDADGYYGTGQTSGDQRRTLALSNGEIIWDLAGNAYEWVSATTEGVGVQPGGSGFAWRDWSDSSVVGTGALSPQPSPSYASAAAASWTTAQGLGRVFSNANEASLRMIQYGGYWSSGTNGGIYSLHLYYLDTQAGSGEGFRVAR